MFYDTIKVNGEEYKLRLTVKELKNLKEALGCSPIKAFEKMGAENDVDFDFIAEVLYHALKKYQPKIKRDNTYDLIDNMIDEGTEITDLIKLVVSIYVKSGLLPKSALEDFDKAIEGDIEKK